MPRTTAGYKTDLRQTERQTDRRLLAVNRSSSIFFRRDYLWSCLIFIIIASYFFSMLVPTTFQPTSDKALALFRSLYEYILENGRARSSSPLSTWYCQYGHWERLFNHCLNGNLCLLIISTAILSVQLSLLFTSFPTATYETFNQRARKFSSSYSSPSSSLSSSSYASFWAAPMNQSVLSSSGVQVEAEGFESANCRHISRVCVCVCMGVYIFLRCNKFFLWQAAEESTNNNNKAKRNEAENCE